MKLLKRVLIALLIVVVAIQFIQPARNKSGQVLSSNVIKTLSVPDNIVSLLERACYDCHSNDTRYPWYMNIQPMGWLMASHIKDGKKNLNFSEFGAYSKRKQANKLRAIATSIKEGSMPISSYTMMHSDAKLSNVDKALIIDWATRTRDSLEAKN